MPSVNAEIHVQPSAGRWLLWVAGPRLGPAVLFWPLLAVFAGVAFGLGRLSLVSGITPLRFHHWLLLGVGSGAVLAAFLAGCGSIGTTTATSEGGLDLVGTRWLAEDIDGKGVIDMQVPVSGNVDDPQFDIGSVISKAFLNLITKAVTAPFTLLAGLVSSEEDLQRLTFASGSAELNAANQAKLGQLSQAMAQRPALTLVINGRLNLSADRERLQKNALGEQLVAAGLTPQEVESKGPAWEKAIQKRFKSLPAGTGEKADPTVREQYLQVVHSIPISDAQMLDLAEQRALAIKTYLVNQAQLEADRAVIEKAALDDKAHIFSGVELGVGT